MCKWWEHGRHIRAGPQCPQEEAVLDMIANGRDPQDELGYGVYRKWKDRAGKGVIVRIRHAQEQLQEGRVREGIDREPSTGTMTG